MPSKPVALPSIPRAVGSLFVLAFLVDLAIHVARWIGQLWMWRPMFVVVCAIVVLPFAGLLWQFLDFWVVDPPKLGR